MLNSNPSSADIFRIMRYSPENKDEWNRFVDRSKNGTFLCKRDYMEYHADRFTDYSLMITRKNKLYALLPACADGKTISSHAGLTYAGLILDNDARVEEVLRLFDSLIDYLRGEGFDKFVYKPAPHIYHVVPAEEDLYALFRHDARLTVRNVSAVSSLGCQLPLTSMRRSALNRSRRNGVIASLSADYADFWALLTANLADRFGAAPTHSLEEIERLSRLFPENILLYTALGKGGELLAGAVVYVTATVAHTQYLSASPEGRSVGALDAVIYQITKDYGKENVRYIDFGTSNENGGRYLNEGLIYQKQGFGARAVCYDTYTLTL